MGKQEKNYRVGEFLTGSVGLPDTFLFYFFASFLDLDARSFKYQN